MRMADPPVAVAFRGGRPYARPVGRAESGMAWVLLVLGGCFEVAFTTCLRFVDGFRNVGWTLAFLVALLASLMLVETATRTIPLGTAYAVWTGIGAAGTVVVGAIWFGEPAGVLRLALIAALVGCVIGLKLTAAH